jgi:Ca2+-binding EF-hand superfamily protein
LPLAVRPKQIEILYERFRKLDREKRGVVSRKELLMIPELAMNPLVDRIVDVVLEEGREESINFRHFLTILSCFSHSKEQALRMLFRVFDVDGDGAISRDDLRKVIRLMVGPPPDDSKPAKDEEAIAATEAEVEAMVVATAQALGCKDLEDKADVVALVKYAQESKLLDVMHVSVHNEDEDA